MKKTNIAISATLLAIICVQGGASVAKQLFPAIGAIGTVTLRIVLSAVLLTLINRPKFSAFTKQKWMYCAMYGFGLAAMNLIFYMAIQRIPLGLAVRRVCRTFVSCTGTVPQTAGCDMGFTGLCRNFTHRSLEE